MKNNYPTINYIGNKQKVADWIIECLPLKKGKVLDLFCGGCSVSYALKSNGYAVISNDILFSNFVLAKAIIENDKDMLCLNDIAINEDLKELSDIRKRIDFMCNKLYFTHEVDELATLVSHSYKLKEYKNYMFLALLRRAMIRKIPYSRMNVKWEEIQKFRDEEYSYKKYGRYRHYHNIPFIEHIVLNYNEYNKAVFKGKKKCIAKNLDALECINSLDEKVDIIYMDPPYPSTMNKYDEFYGYFDDMFGIDLKSKIDLTQKNTFLDNFYILFEQAAKKTKYIVISLNNKCYPSYQLLSDKIKPLVSKIKVYTKAHVYKITGKENKNTNFEILMVCKIRGDL